MGRWKWVIWGTVFIGGAGLGLFLVSEGLNRASAWVAVLGFPLVLAGAAAGVWSVILAARTGREPREGMALEQESQAVRGTGTPARPGVDTSGPIRQQGEQNVIHTGQGNINVNITDR